MTNNNNDNNEEQNNRKKWVWIVLIVILLGAGLYFYMNPTYLVEDTFMEGAPEPETRVEQKTEESSRKPETDEDISTDKEKEVSPDTKPTEAEQGVTIPPEETPQDVTPSSTEKEGEVAEVTSGETGDTAETPESQKSQEKIQREGEEKAQETLTPQDPPGIEEDGETKKVREPEKDTEGTEDQTEEIRDQRADREQSAAETTSDKKEEADRETIESATEEIPGDTAAESEAETPGETAELKDSKQITEPETPTQKEEPASTETETIQQEENNLSKTDSADEADSIEVSETEREETSDPQQAESISSSTDKTVTKQSAEDIVGAGDTQEKDISPSKSNVEQENNLQQGQKEESTSTAVSDKQREADRQTDTKVDEASSKNIPEQGTEDKAVKSGKDKENEVPDQMDVDKAAETSTPPLGKEEIKEEKPGLFETLGKRLETGFASIRELVQDTGDSRPEVEEIEVLAVGFDDRQSVSKGKIEADSIMLITLDLENRDLSFTAIPPNWEVSGQEIKKYSREQLPEEIEKISGSSPDYHIYVGYEGFKDIVDELGGIEVELAEQVTVPDLGLYLKEGKNLLSGKEALNYARWYDYPEDGLGRIRRQQQVLEGIIDKVLQPNTLMNIPKLYETVVRGYQTIETDMDQELASNLFKFVRDRKDFTIKFSVLGDS